ncbi:MULTISPECIES: hypothetical protein [Aerosakkonema]|uniref:hypothetical protein n=1 Tax=Aerosakkonema TaxID=1246629 RepID=UPI0035B9E9F4
MELSPLLLQWQEEALHEGARKAIRTFIEAFFRVQFGDLDEELSKIVEPLVELPSEESVPLLLQSSREELLARFGS